MNQTKKNIITLAALASVWAGVSAQQAPATSDGSKPKAYLVSDAHLDTQWNWDIQTTIKEYVWNTINQNLFLLDKYPNYIFNFEGGVKYSWMKEYYPREYELMKQYIANGRWHICGASWDATDAIVPSVESAIRNVMLGQQFYRDEFGVESTDIFLPDCFGFGWTLPTVASHCGLIGFSSQKLGWRHLPFHDGKRYPYTVGLWKGVDGSSIMMAHGFNYGQRWEMEDLSSNKMLQKRVKESPLNVTYHYYGTGDIGGSPSMNSVWAVENSLGGNGPLEIISATSDQVYKDYLPFDSHPELPVYSGELLMDVHGTGCYTSQAAMKLYNRQNELLGDAAERAAVAADLLGLVSYPSKSLTESWRRFIFHQFHDDLTGTSIPRAYEFSWNDEMLSMKQFANVMSTSVSAVASQMDTRVKGTPVVLYNPLGVESTDVVELQLASPKAPGSVEVYTAAGRKVAAQLLGYADGKARMLVEATVPANGYAVYDVRMSGSSKEKGTEVAANSVENSVYRLTLDPNGDITSIFDKRSGKELVQPGKAVRLALFTRNESFEWPAWEVLKSTIDADPVSITDDVAMTMVENGPVRKTLRVEKKHGDSRFCQYIRLYEGDLADRVDFYNEVDWRSTNSLLKAEFPLSVANDVATYDLGVGSVKRGNNQPNAYEVYAQYWADLTDRSGDYGVTVMNDSKYGWDKPADNTLRLTLLHTPKTKGGYAYQDHQDLGHHTFTYSLTGHQGSLAKASACHNADRLNQRVKGFATVKHPGALGKSFSLASADNDNVAIKALKQAEASDEYVVRVYDVAGDGSQNANIAFASDILSAVEADGTEKTIGDAPFSGNTLKVTVTPNSIRTYKVRLRRREAPQANYANLPLQLDKKCFSWNQMPGDAGFEAGYSYAAELVPAAITAGGVPFKLANEALLNGMKCEGDTLRLPQGHNYSRLYLLAASAIPEHSLTATIRAGKNASQITVPSYTGFIGQWGHEGHTQGYMDSNEVAYVGTHRHSSEGDHPYEFTYMFKYGIDIPANATEIILPDMPEVVLFSATLASGEHPMAEAATTMFRTSIPEGAEAMPAVTARENILKPEHLVAWSGFVNDKEHPRHIIDGNEDTKWCDVSGIPSFVEFDLGESTPVNAWKVINAASEDLSYVTSSCLLQGRNSKDEEWQTLDYFTGNKKNVIRKELGKTENVRYLRLLVVHPVQDPDGRATRIYELAVYK